MIWFNLKRGCKIVIRTIPGEADIRVELWVSKERRDDIRHSIKGFSHSFESDYRRLSKSTEVRR